MAYCPKCGFQNADNAIYCARCASALAAGQGHGSQTVVVVGNGAQQAPAGSNPGTVWLWLNIVMTVLCCCSNILSIIGIIFGAMSVSKFNSGLYAESRSNANVAKWMFIIGLILGALGAVASILAGAIPVVLTFISGLLAAASSSY